MAYTTVEKVRSVLMGYFDPKAPDAKTAADKLTDAQIEYAITNAEAQINASIRRRYEVPFSPPVPDLLVVIATDIAAALSDLTFRGSSAVYQSPLHPIRLRYDRANVLLSQIAGGSLDLLDITAEDAEVIYNPDQVLDASDVFLSGIVPYGNSGEFSEFLVTRRVPRRSVDHG